MPRKNPVQVSELEVAQRLVSARKSTLLARREFCRRHGLEYHRYANYELGRVPLTYTLGDSVCRRLSLNQRWLATGKEPWHQYIPIPSKLAEHASKCRSFREACEGPLWDHLAQACNAIATHLAGARARILAERGGASDAPGEDAFLNELRDLFALAPPGLRRSLYDTVRLSALGFMRLGGAIRDKKSKGAMGQDERSNLHTITVSRNSVGEMKPLLPPLLRRLARTTKPTGKKAELARWLGVKPPRISEWLSGRVEPGGETTLRLLAWIEAEENREG